MLCIDLYQAALNLSNFREENVQEQECLAGTSIWPRLTTNGHLTHITIYLVLLTFYLLIIFLIECMSVPIVA